MGTTRILIQLDLFGGAPSQVIDVPVPAPEPEPEPLEVIPVLVGQLDLLDARAVTLRPVMDLLADARFEDAVAGVMHRIRRSRPVRNPLHAGGMFRCGGAACSVVSTSATSSRWSTRRCTSRRA